jgi:Kef-type K+ transport system membrane component KefB
VFSDPSVTLFRAAAVVLAVVGKFGGCSAAARLRGEPGPVAVRVGALMNARGLMQLIALDIGLSRLDRRDARSRAAEETPRDERTVAPSN